MEDLRITYRELGYYVVYLNIILAVLLGSLPLIAGLMLKSAKRAWIGFILTVIGGALLGVFLSYPIAVIFLWLIVRAHRAVPAGETPVESAETPGN